MLRKILATLSILMISLSIIYSAYAFYVYYGQTKDVVNQIGSVISCATILVVFWFAVSLAVGEMRRDNE